MAAVALLVPLGTAAGTEPITAESYVERVKPLLFEKCIACHGAAKQEAGLRLDTAATVKTGGESGPALSPGKPAESLLLERVTADDLVRMPPADEGSRLTGEQVELLRSWIAAGVPAPENEKPQADPRTHWAFQTPESPPVPAVEAEWIRSEIDRFLLAEQERVGTVAVPEATRGVLLRRLSLNLVGLPPTREELRAFLADDSPDAWERAVDRLLESPRHGERWARHFMDVWRYSDPSGYGKEIRDGREHLWRWRDWIVESLNDDKPYERMIVEMLAADEAAPEDLETLRATGFLARNWYKFNRNVWLDNVVEHSSKAFLGLTTNCARCHDHKYDPIAQREYYRLRAVFESYDVRDDPFAGDGTVVRAYDAHHDRPTYLFVQGREENPDEEHPLPPDVPDVLGGELRIEPVELPVFAYYPALRPENRQRQLAAATESVEAAKQELAAKSRETGAEDEEGSKVERAHLLEAEARERSLRARIAAELVKYGLEQGNFDELARVAARADRELAVRELERQLAEDRRALAEAEAAAADDAKAQQKADEARKRIETRAGQLAEAEAKLETDSTSYASLGPQYPRTSTGRRLAYARWIADRRNPLTARVLVNHVWMRHFGEPLVERVFDFGTRSERPRHADLLDWLAVEFMENGWSLKALHRRIALSGAYRLSSSTASAVEANLRLDPDNHTLWKMNARRMEAEAVRDSVLHLGGTLDTAMGGPPIEHTQGQTVPRRSLYFRQDKERQMTFLAVFDGANVNECYRRTATVAPQQSLALFNSRIAAEQSAEVAAAFAERDDEAFVAAAFEHVLSRRPSAEESAECLAFLDDLREIESARAQLVRVLFNHHDFVTIR